MCNTCGCGDAAVVPVDVHARILAANDRLAQHNREHFAGCGVLAINVMGSPGSGKTALLEATAAALGAAARIGALAGDLATERDADRLKAAGIDARAIQTGSACHLDAQMVHEALHDFEWHDFDYLFVENVGNLVCPAVYDVGQAFNVVCLAVTEGEDKPLKYPLMFRKADVVVVTKIDLLPHLPDVKLESIHDAIARVMPNPIVLELSARTGAGVDGWARWLEVRRPALAGRSL